MASTKSVTCPQAAQYYFYYEYGLPSPKCYVYIYIMQVQILPYLSNYNLSDVGQQLLDRTHA
jgi:hypothetical protein